MKKIMVTVLLVVSMTGCTGIVPSSLVDGDTVHDSLVIKVDTITNGQDYEFDFDIKL
ncbi:hypothetical protein [Bacteroides sp.]|uniref:hypothetical protein n=1 Tax=Bacteroides sp. TaxID=29523 RepID=UPI002622C71B|nr:hypothetical protein [Bacteroides sp.]